LERGKSKREERQNSNMPIRLEDSQELLSHGGEVVVGGTKRMWQGFADFALQDNVLEVAVGLM
jgi:large conductance mechanosensitive channel